MKWVCVFTALLLLGRMGFAQEMTKIDPRNIRLGGEIGRRIDVTVNNNLLAVDIEKDFLAPFKLRNQTSGFVGTGMFLDGAVRLAHHTNDLELVTLKNHIADTLIATQESDGYIGLMRPAARIKKLWDVHEMAYIVLGLANDGDLFQRETSLAAARNLGDYLLERLTDTPPPECFEGDLNPDMPVTGLADAMLALHKLTGDNKYRQFVLDILDMEQWRKPIVCGRHWPIDGHVYAYIDKCLIQLWLDPTGKRPELRTASEDALEFMLEENGLTISGGCGDHECWQNTQAGMNNLAETCATVYLLRFCDELFRQTGAPIFGDLMERIIYNTLFAAQSPDGRRLRYYTGFEAPRRYYDGDTYCCPNNYRRGVADLPAYVLYQTDTGVVVNLYTAYAAEITLADGTRLHLDMDTEYPSSGDVTLAVSPEKAKTFTVALRMPRWCNQPLITINGAAAESVGVANGLFVIKRVWNKNDVVTLTLPMDWRFVKGRRSQVGRVAVMRGPQVFG
ncbi:MAG TPA: hypothetical protein ENN29_00345, partial [Candidatus Hydrogenedentes bacterium]|nr:hypothetical protein [Candidatus Hydrogenedentota bacterium]